MTPEEYKKQLIQAQAKAKTRSEIRAVVTVANGALEASKITGREKRAFFEDLICEAQDNTATMDNAGEAQEIVNQLLNG